MNQGAGFVTGFCFSCGGAEMIICLQISFERFRLGVKNEAF
jgi:hypothetical protein